MEDFVPPPIRLAPADSVSSELAGDDDSSSGSVEPQETSTLIISSKESQRKESTLTEWTDEKHSLYLKSMEASFIDQLYSSLDSVSWRTQNDCSSDSTSSRNMHATTRRPSGQFKVLQDGCWSKINFGREKSQLNKAGKSCVLPANPWIQHFRTGCRQETAASPSFQEKPPSPTASQQSPVSHAYLCSQDLLGSDEEVMDQNFVNEDVAKEKASVPYSRKRMKTSVVALSNDQVVPFGTFPVTEIAGKYAPPKK